MRGYLFDHRVDIKMLLLSRTAVGQSLRAGWRFAGLHTSRIALGEAALDRAERLKSRFWKTVSLSPPSSECDGFRVLLDNRAIRTPGGQTIVIPQERELLATCMAQEWNEQDKVLKPHALPLTSLAARALDACSDSSERVGIQADLLRYLENETIW